MYQINKIKDRQILRYIFENSYGYSKGTFEFRGILTSIFVIVTGYSKKTVLARLKALELKGVVTSVRIKQGRVWILTPYGVRSVLASMVGI